MSADLRLREEQVGFRVGRACVEQILTLRNILEQCIEYQSPMAVNFVNFEKAFGSIHRQSLLQVAELYGIPGEFIFRSLYCNSGCCVKIETGTTNFSDIFTGVRQGCILSPFLCLLVVDFVMHKVIEEEDLGIKWTGEKRLTDLAFADDIALLAGNEEELQRLTSNLEEAAIKVG